MQPFSNLPSVENELYNEAYFLVRWLPMRPYCSIHVCMLDTPSYQIFARIMVALTVPEIRYHHKIHTGSSCEGVVYNLLPFGIPTDLLPVTATGGVKVKELQRWLDRRKRKEQFLEQNPGVPFEKFELPGIRDVLYAKGKPYQSHLGNQEYLVQINRSLQKHERAERKEKRVIVLQVIKKMKDIKTRFLVRDQDGWWVEATEGKVISKVSKAFSNASTAAAQSRPVHVLGLDGEQTWKRQRAAPYDVDDDSSVEDFGLRVAPDGHDSALEEFEWQGLPNDNDSAVGESGLRVVADSNDSGVERYGSFSLDSDPWLTH
jgi:hypothetical protein